MQHLKTKFAFPILHFSHKIDSSHQCYILQTGFSYKHSFYVITAHVIMYSFGTIKLSGNAFEILVKLIDLHMHLCKCIPIRSLIITNSWL
jgi:hypothetical protein